jgi:hypothetical protein
MRQFQCVQARSIVIATLEVLTRLEDLREAGDIGKVWNENILPAFYHIKNCNDPLCRAYWSELSAIALRFGQLEEEAKKK